MAEINTASADQRKTGIRRSKKLSTKVDLTPMVDLGFLLITFFIFSTKMSETKCVRLFMPDDTVPAPPTDIPQSESLTALLLAKNRVFYYEGILGEALKNGRYGVTTYAFDNGIGQIIRNKQKALEKIGKRNDLVFIFKPTAESNYGNVIDIMDDILINDVRRYMLMDITQEEKTAIVTKVLIP